MKAFYLSSKVELTDELREKLRGHRVENADVFSGVASSVTQAEVMGDYTDIVAALKEQGVDVVGAAKSKAKPKAKVKPEPVVEPKTEAQEPAQPDLVEEVKPE